MEIEKEIRINVNIELEDRDICNWIEERISEIDIIMTDEGKEKMKPLKAKYYEKWLEIYHFFQNPTAELYGEEPMPEEARVKARTYFN